MRAGMLSLWMTVGLVCTVLALPQPPVENSDEEKERLASERFLTVVEKNPRRGTAFDRVYGYHVERGTLDELLKKYRERISKNSKDGLAWMIVGLVESQRGKDAAAVKAFQQAEEARPEDPLASYYLGQVLVLVGQPDKAAEALERAIARKPARTDMLDIFQALGRVYQRGQNVEQALSVWQRLEKLFPDDQRVREQIAAVLVEEGQFAQALPRLEELAKLNTDPYRKVTFQMEAAELKVRLGQMDKALVDLESILNNLEPDSWLFRDARRRIEEAFLRSDDQAGLAKYYENWLGKHVDDVDAMGRLAKTLATLGRTPDARKWLDNALKKAPSRKDLRLAMIEHLAFEQKFAEAGQQYEALDQAEPNNPDVLREWGKLLLKDSTKSEAERKKNAAEVWKRLVERRPNDALTATQVADLFRQASLQEESLALYRKAVELAPEAGQYREYLGEYLHSLKKNDEALTVWRAMAQGKLHTAKNLARLAEVLASFAYQEEALKTLGEASAMDKTDFALQLRYAEMLAQNEKFDDALKQLDAVGALSKSDEEKEAVLVGRIRCRQGQDKLSEVADQLSKTLAAGNGATEKWHELARYREALRDMPEAMKAAKEAVKLAPKDLPYLTTLARLHESGGEMLAAADSYRQLAALDRKNKAEYLTNVAKLEARLGRREPALAAGKDLLAAAPGNPEHHKFYADLCFQLGNEEEGLEALRRSVRANPGEPNVLNNLAGALSERFRTGEAIELYWRAFTKANDVEARNGIVVKLTDLYLQTNQFDKLLERLERERREPGRLRDFTFCVAQAHQSAGDFGAARRELETLLSSNPRDNIILQQLATLAESENDDQAALKYLRQLTQAAPAKDMEEKLARVLDRLGQGEEAQSIWARLALAEQDQIKIIAGVDRLIQNDKPEVALEVLGRVRREGSAQWEALYREGVALVNLKRPVEAEARFRSLLGLKNSDDELSMAEAVAQAKFNKSAAGAQGMPRRGYIPPQTRHYAYSQIQYATGLISREYYGGMNPRQWIPIDYGSARMAALAWMLVLAKKANQEDALIKPYRTAFDAAARQAAPDALVIWDWYHLTRFRGDEKDQAQASEQLAKVNTPNAQWTTLQKYIENRQVASNRRGQAQNKQPPKPADLERALQAYRQLSVTQPSYATSQAAPLLADLKLAKRDNEADAIYQAMQKSATKPEDLRLLLGIAASRDDQAVFFKIADTLRKMPARNQMSSLASLSYPLVTLMGKALETKEMGKIPGLIDYQLQAWCAERREKLQSGPRRNSSGRGGMGVQIMLGKSSANNRNNYLNLDYPEPNQVLDSSTIIVLRNAFEAYKEADLSSDLVAWLTKQKDKAPGSDTAVYHMALSGIAWWEGDKPLAIQHLTTVCQLDSGNVELQLDLAVMHVRMQNFEEALTVIETITPLDQQSTTRKEELALSVAQRLGNLDRARLATQRLFGLRLDTDAQARLARTMQNLGMHDLAEAVLARARRSAGNKTNALTSLMQQFATQGKNEVALQIAYQLLRKTPPPSRGNNYYVQGEEEMRAARSQAVQVLSRSGKLSELINRTETQLKSAPTSVALWRTLIEYHQAAGNKEKVKEAVQKLSQLRPEDSSLRMQVAQLYREMGDFGKACDEYLAAFKKEPQLFANRYWEIEQTFNQANQNDKLLKFMEEIDLKQIGQPYVVTNLMMMQLRNEKTRDAGMRLFKKAWVAFKDQRQNLIANLYDEQVWKMPEIFDYVLEGMLPGKDTVMTDPWGNVGQVLTYYSDGRLITYLSRCLDMASSQGRLDELVKKVDEALVQQPKWLGGQVVKAALLARQGQSEEAAKIIKTLSSNKDEPLSASVRRCLAQEMEQVASAHLLAIELYESCKDEAIENWGYSPELDVAPRLAKLFIEEGRKSEARALLLKKSKADDSNSPYDTDYRDYQRLQQMNVSASQLAGMGFTIDAVKLYSEMLSEPQRFENAQRYYGGNMRQQMEGALSNTLANLDDEAMSTALVELLTPNKDPKARLTGDVKPNAIDPIMLVNVKDLEKASISSACTQILAKVGQSKEKAELIRKKLADLRKEFPDDYSVAVLEVLFELSQTATDQPASADAVAAVERLVQFAEAHPLEKLDALAKPNARHRSEASKQLVLWLAARAAFDRSNVRAQGVKLAEKSLLVVKRMNNEEYQLAMLKELGQAELKAGNRAGAEERWREMLKLVFAKTNKVAQAPAATGAVRAATGAPAVVVPSKGPRPQPPPVATRAVPMSAVAPQGRGNVQTASGRVPVVTSDQADKGFDIARLAAEEGMLELSLQAAGQVVHAGPPVQLANANPNQSFRRVYTTSGMAVEEEVGGGSVDVYHELTALCDLWTRKQAAPEKVYQVLREAVLPASRPTEVFLYAQAVSPHAYSGSRRRVYSHQQGIEKVSSAGFLLVQWAVKAGQVDALSKLIEVRAKQPTALPQCQVLRAQLAALTNQKEGNTALAWFLERLAKETLQNTAELACHAALPSLQSPALYEKALQVTEAAVQSYTTRTTEGATEPAMSLQLFLVKHYLNKGQGKDKIKKGIEEYLKVSERGGRNHDPDSWSQQRKGFLIEASGLYAEADLPELALDLMGQYVDLSNQKTRYYYGESGGDSSLVVPRLAKYLLTKSPAERYETLKTWTFPTATRKSIRWLACYTPLTDAPLLFRPAEATAEGMISNMSLLIDAARQTGKLDELQAATEAAVKEKVEQSEPLAMMILVVKKDATAQARIQQLLETVRKEKPPEEDYSYQNRQRSIWPSILLIQAMMKEPTLHEQARGLSDWLVAQGGVHGEHTDRLSQAGHLMTAQQAMGKPVALPGSPRLKQWQPIQKVIGTRGTPSSWVSQPGMISHLGGDEGKLLFDKPLTGSFDVTGELFVSFGTSTIGFGGVQWLVLTHGQPAQLADVDHQDVKSIPGNFVKGEGFYPFRLEVRPQLLRYYFNGRLLWEDKTPSPTSPWLTVSLPGHTESAVRNMRLTGQPAVAKEVILVAADRLDGWSSSHYSESRPPRYSVGGQSQSWDSELQAYPVVKKETGNDAYDWSAQAGVLHGRKGESGKTTSLPSYLSYHRPLQSGDSVEYEFRYDPKLGYEVHPALGNVAFYLQPDGVKLLWLDDRLAKGIATSVAGVSDKQGKGAETLPLKAGEWNKVTLRREGDVVKIELNGQQVYQRTQEAGAGYEFGFFHWKERGWAQARNIVMRGNWATSVSPGDLLEAQASTPEQARLDAWLLNEKFQESLLFPIMVKAQGMPPAERYAYLKDWLLPAQGSVTARVYAGFGNFNESTAAQNETSGEWFSPATALVEAAKASGQLPALAEQLGKLNGANPFDRRCLAALRVMVKLAAGQDATSDWETLEKGTEKLDERIIARERWPELVAARAALDSAALRARAAKLLEVLVTKYHPKKEKTAVAYRQESQGQDQEQEWSGMFHQEWPRALRYLQGQAKLKAAGEQAQIIGAGSLSRWTPVTQVTAWARASGTPAPVWVKTDSSIVHHPGTEEDMLYFRTPLRGTFTVECELSFQDGRGAQLHYAGQRITPHDDLKKFSLQQFDKLERVGNIIPPLEKLGDWYPCKVVVGKGMLGIYLKDRKIHETRLSADADPWLAIYCPGNQSGGVRNLKITGQPSVPEVLDLTKAPSLLGWLPTYYGETIIKRNQENQYHDPNTELTGWEKRGEEIIGVAARKSLGKHSESILRYHRPLLEDSQLEYEFYHEAGKSMTHPAIDRLVFLLDKEGAKVHWLSNGYVRDTLTPDNVAVEPETRRGTGPLPLKEGAWNRMMITLRGDVVTVQLNGQDIAQRKLNPGNTRHFGFFHYADETQVRVRNVKLRGDWSRELPPPDKLMTSNAGK